jgi:hypothetical protein
VIVLNRGRMGSKRERERGRRGRVRVWNRGRIKRKR